MPLDSKDIERLRKDPYKEESLQLLNCLVKQNEDILRVQTEKLESLDGLVEVTQKSFKMYRIKNMWSGVFGLVGLLLTVISTALMAVGIMYLPNETKALFNEIFMLMGF